MWKDQIFTNRLNALFRNTQLIEDFWKFCEEIHSRFLCTIENPQSQRRWVPVHICFFVLCSRCGWEWHVISSGINYTKKWTHQFTISAHLSTDNMKLSRFSLEQARRNGQPLKHLACDYFITSGKHNETSRSLPIYTTPLASSLTYKTPIKWFRMKLYVIWMTRWWIRYSANCRNVLSFVGTA